MRGSIMYESVSMFWLFQAAAEGQRAGNISTQRPFEFFREGSDHVPCLTLAVMGFFTSCWSALLQLTAYAHMMGSHEMGQQPLHLPTESTPHKEIDNAATGVTFTPQNASPDFTCQYPTLTGWEACNNATDRGCWLTDPSQKESLYQYNISTDYESFSPPGITREYWLNVSVHPISADGYLKPLAQVFNQSYPGPLLEACWGDEVIVHVTNLDPKNGHTTHWHGIRQLGTNQMDGVNGMYNIIFILEAS